MIERYLEICNTAHINEMKIIFLCLGILLTCGKHLHDRINSVRWGGGS
jgi:hypothetical protein